jgi:hypothetical protein
MIRPVQTPHRIPLDLDIADEYERDWNPQRDLQMRTPTLPALLIVGWHLASPTPVAAKGAWMEMPQPELPPGYVYISKIWLDDKVEPSAEIAQGLNKSWERLVSLFQCCMLGSAFTLLVMKLYGPIPPTNRSVQPTDR